MTSFTDKPTNNNLVGLGRLLEAYLGKVGSGSLIRDGAALLSKHYIYIICSHSLMLQG